jgi:hypothetical protein
VKRGIPRLLGAIAALALPMSFAAAGPPGHAVRVGILEVIAPTFDPDRNPGHRALVEGLKELGYAPGRDIVFKYKSAEGDPDAVPGWPRSWWPPAWISCWRREAAPHLWLPK